MNLTAYNAKHEPLYVKKVYGFDQMVKAVVSAPEFNRTEYVIWMGEKYVIRLEDEKAVV